MIKDCTAMTGICLESSIIFTGNWSKSDKGGCWEIKVQEVEEPGTGSGKF